jgi:hypothetical protein
MALIYCPECNRPISDKANSCPACGYPLEKKGGVWIVILFILYVISIIFIILTSVELVERGAKLEEAVAVIAGCIVFHLISTMLERAYSRK